MKTAVSLLRPVREVSIPCSPMRAGVLPISLLHSCKQGPCRGEYMNVMSSRGLLRLDCIHARVFDVCSNTPYHTNHKQIVEQSFDVY